MLSAVQGGAHGEEGGEVGGVLRQGGVLRGRHDLLLHFQLLPHLQEPQQLLLAGPGARARRVALHRLRNGSWRSAAPLLLLRLLAAGIRAEGAWAEGFAVPTAARRGVALVSGRSACRPRGPHREDGEVG